MKTNIYFNSETLAIWYLLVVLQNHLYRIYLEPETLQAKRTLQFPADTHSGSLRFSGHFLEKGFILGSYMLFILGHKPMSCLPVKCLG